MTPIDNKNYLIAKTLIVLNRISIDEAKKITLLICDEVMSEIDLLRIEDIEYKKTMFSYWKRTKQEIEKL
jgi:hypothetical protein